ncbi:MAG TPA: hypothetical protein VGL08_13665 [Paraburkholderia sp.]|jgi:hypothetical protein
MKVSSQNAFTSHAVENTGADSAAIASPRTPAGQSTTNNYPTHYPNGQVKDEFTPLNPNNPQTGQAGTYRHYDDSGHLRELDLKAPDGHTALERHFDKNGNQQNVVHNPDGSSSETDFNHG